MNDGTMNSERLTTSDIAGAGRAPVMEARDTAHHPEATEEETPLFAREEADGFRTRWSAIQTGFVDEPRKAVEEADALVAEVMTRLAEVFARERTSLEGQWDRGDQISTEDLRQALRRYRTFFARLLSV
jgi:hypothetical protein